MHDRAAKATAEALSEQESIDLSFIGVMVEREDDLAVVNIGEARIAVPVLDYVFPVPGEYVRLMRVGRLTFLIGPARTRSVSGVVSASPGGSVVTVEYPAGSGVTKNMRYPKGYSPVIGDPVLIDWASGGVVMTVLASAAAAAPVVNPVSVPVRSYAVTFTALDSGTQNNGSGRFWTNEVYAGDTTVGGWFYGTKIKDTIPDNATINRARVYLPIRQNYGGAPNLAIHNYGSKPGSPMGFVGEVALSGARSGWVDLPAGWGLHLATYASGLGMNHGGYNIYHGTQRDGMSGAVDIAWTV